MSKNPSTEITALKEIVLNNNEVLMEALKFAIKANNNHCIQLLLGIPTFGEPIVANKLLARLMGDVKNDKDREVVFSEAMSSFFLSILSNKDNEIYAAAAISQLQNVINLYGKSKLKKDFTLQGMEALMRIYSCFQIEGRDKLLQYIKQKATSLNSPIFSAGLYNQLCVEHLGKSDITNALIYGKTAHEIYQKNPSQLSKELSHEILYNLGLAWKFYDSVISLGFFEKAQKLSPNDLDTVKEKIYIYVKLKDSQNARKGLQKIEDAELKALFAINISLELDHNMSLSKVLSINNFGRLQQNLSIISKDEEKYLLYLDIWKKLCLEKRDYKSAIDLLSDSLTNMSLNNIPTHLAKILDIFVAARSWQEGLKFITETYSKFSDILKHDSSLVLKYYEFLIYLENGLTKEADNNLKYLQDNSHLAEDASKIASKAKQLTFHKALEQKDFDKALSNWDPLWPDARKLLQLTIKSQNYFKNGIGIIDEDKDYAQTSKAESEFIFIELSEWEEDADDPFVALDYQAIHAYNQQRKENLINQPLENNGLQKQNSWKISESCVYGQTEDDNIVHVKGNFYAVINPNLNVDYKSSLQFANALQKGMAKGAHGKNGIKILPKFIELKINGDKRLATDVIYKNEHGKYLIEFSEVYTHKQIQDKFSNSSLETITCQSLFATEIDNGDISNMNQTSFGTNDSYEKPTLESNDSDIHLSGNSHEGHE